MNVSKISSRAGFVPRNAAEVHCVDLITKAHVHLNKTLRLETKLVIERKADWGRDTSYAGFFRANENLIVLNFRRMRGNQLMTVLTVLSHEIRHALQYQLGWLTVNRSRKVFKVGGERIESNTWKGEYFDKVAYRKAPWELDANEQQVPIAQSVVDAGILTDEECEFVLPGKRLRSKLENKTLRELKDLYKGRVLMIFTAYAETKDEYKARRQMARNELDQKMTAIGVSWSEAKKVYVVDSLEKAKKVAPIQNAFKKGVRRREDHNGFKWMALDQLSAKFPKWTTEAVNHAFNHDAAIVDGQYVTWQTRELDITDFVC